MSKPIDDRFRAGQDGYRPLRKLRTAVSGIRQAVLMDFSVQYKFVLSVASLALAAYMLSPLYFLVLLAVTGLMLVTEIMNTVIETLCDYMEPRHDRAIALIKDMAAGAATVGIAVWLTTNAFIVYAALAS